MASLSADQPLEWTEAPSLTMLQQAAELVQLSQDKAIEATSS